MVGRVQFWGRREGEGRRREGLISPVLQTHSTFLSVTLRHCVILREDSSFFSAPDVTGTWQGCVVCGWDNHTHTNTQVLLRKCWDLTNPLYNNIIFLISGRKYVGAVNRLQIFKRVSYMICGLLIAMNGISIMTTLKILLGCYWKWQCIWWTRSAMLLIIAALEQVWA